MTYDEADTRLALGQGTQLSLVHVDRDAYQAFDEAMTSSLAQLVERWLSFSTPSALSVARAPRS